MASKPGKDSAEGTSGSAASFSPNSVCSTFAKIRRTLTNISNHQKNYNFFLILISLLLDHINPVTESTKRKDSLCSEQDLKPEKKKNQRDQS
jgi:hypothetical protein